MEQSKKVQRSEVWKQIYKVVKQIPRQEITEDAPDAPSVTCELEELFLKLLSIQHISNRRELYFTFMKEYNALMGKREHQILKEEVEVLLTKYSC